MINIQLGTISLKFSLWSILKNTLESISKVMESAALPPLVVLSYSIARDKPDRNIGPPQRYDETDLVTYAF